MSTPTYEKGTIKVVWIEDNPDEIYSKMFESEQEAEQFARTKRDYLIFALLTQKKMTTFSWKLLPYGHHEIYRTLFQQYKRGYLGKVLQLLGKAP